MGWIEFIAAMALFMASHRIPAALGVKGWLTRMLGPRGYTLVFSLVSLLLFWWVIAAAGRAPFLPLWDQGVAARWAVNIAMPVAIALASFGISAPNPFAFEGRASGFDPARPGIAGVTRQPLLWALLLWSAAHLWANGDVAHVLLFGSFVLFSALGLRIVESRRRSSIGAAWTTAAARTALVPGWALLTGRWRPTKAASVPRLAIAAVTWAALWHLHLPVIGVSPAP